MPAPRALAFLCIALFSFALAAVPSVAFADDGTSMGTTLQGGSVLLSVVVGVYTWVSNTQRADRRDVEKLAQRVAKLETRVEHASTREDLGRLQGAIEAQSTRLDSLFNELARMNRRFEHYEQAVLRGVSA